MWESMKIMCMRKYIRSWERERESMPEVKVEKEKVWESMSMSEVKVVKVKEKVWESMRKLIVL